MYAIGGAPAGGGGGPEEAMPSFCCSFLESPTVLWTTDEGRKMFFTIVYAIRLVYMAVQHKKARVACDNLLVNLAKVIPLLEFKDLVGVQIDFRIEF